MPVKEELAGETRVNCARCGGTHIVEKSDDPLVCIANLKEQMKECPTLYGLYVYRSTDGHSTEWLEGVDVCKDNLRRRWNAPIEKKIAELDKEKAHEDYYRYLPAMFEGDEDSVRYSGSTGGGYSSVSYRVGIRELEQQI